ncbi:hypothetical protein A8F94_05355 [Bacillus sp. FJAT-27225]|uniref:hypothetical protein n=1 Tax=Bacillus sp. FJAT-27225 TaxID=1743144 RepID=UPI00080C321D|nr:hypothetical protein [Bacillus sp. FJAT-27225]OCA91288.1 hypothetical protein A8F94_05355 [Bacillus sp. FJAT-27225]
MHIIKARELDYLYKSIKPILDTATIIEIDDRETEETLHHYLFLHQYYDRIVSSSYFTKEEVLHSQYYWYHQFKEMYFDRFEHDGGMEQQAFKLLEHLDRELEGNIDWPVIEKIVNGEI